MQLWDNPNKGGKKTKERWKKYYFAPSPPPPAADGVLGSGSANVYLCVFAGNWRILTVIIVRLIITTVKVSVLRGDAAFTKRASRLDAGPVFCSTDQQFKGFSASKEADISGYLTLPPSRPTLRLT